MAKTFEDIDALPEAPTADLLDSSKVFTSQRDWRASYLEESEVLADVVRKYDSVVHETDSQPVLQTSRNRDRSSRTYFTQMETVMSAVSRIMLESGQELSKDTADAVFRPLFRSGIYMDEATEMWSRLAVQHAEMRAVVIAASRELTTKVEEDIEENPEAQYDLLKFLAVDMPDCPDTDDYSASSFHTLMFVDEHVTQVHGTVKKLCTALKAGQYDGLILRDILRLAEADALPKTLSSVKDMWHFMKMLGGSATAEDVINRVVLSEGSWPPQLRLSIDAERGSLLARVDSVSTRYRHSIESYRFIPKEVSPEEELAIATESLKTALYNDPRAPQFSSREELVRAAHDKRRRNRPVPAEEQDNGSVDVEIIIAEPRKTHFLHAETFISDETHPDYNETVDEFVAKHGNTREVREDVEKMIEYVRKVDFSKGLVRGIKRYEWAITINGKSLPVHGLKPTEAIGLPTKTKVAKRSRLFFTFDNDNVYVLAVETRNDVKMIQRRWSVKEATTT